MTRATGPTWAELRRPLVVLLVGALAIVASNDRSPGPEPYRLEDDAPAVRLTQRVVMPAPAGPKGDCGVTPIDESYGARLETTSGRPGQPLVVSGTTYRDEGGRWAPSDRIEVWWNYDWRAGPPGVLDSQRLLAIETGSTCRFRAATTVPDAEPGSYRVTTLIFDENGHGVFSEQRFTVEP